MAIALDYAWSHPSLPAIRGVGATGVIRYVCWPGKGGGKCITAAEYAALRGAGIDVTLVWEYTATELLGGRSKGVAIGQSAAAQMAAFGYTGALYAAADWDVTAGQWPAVRDCLAGIASVVGPGRTGLYGPWDALSWALRDGVARWWWQAGMSTAWSAGRNRARWPGAHLRQIRQQSIGGADCDVNEILINDYGQDGGDMSLAPDERDWLLNNRVAIFYGGESCGDAVPDPLPGSQAGNSILDLLQHMRRKIDAGTQVTLSAEDRQAIADAAAAAVGDQVATLKAEVDEMRQALHAAGVGLAG